MRILVIDFRCRKIVADMHSRTADVKPHKACCNDDGENDPVQAVREHGHLVVGMDLRMRDRERFFALRDLQKRRREKERNRPVQDTSRGTENAQFLKSRERNQNETCKERREGKTGNGSRRADAEERAFDAELRAQVLFAFKEVTVQDVVDDLQGLPGEHDCKQQSKEVDAAVEQVRACHRCHDRSGNGERRNKDKLRLSEKVENEEQQDEGCRHDADHLRFGEETLAGLDGLVNFPGKMDMHAVGFCFCFEDIFYVAQKPPVRFKVRYGMCRINFYDADGPVFIGMAYGEFVEILLFEVAQKLFALFCGRSCDGIYRALQVDEQRVVLQDVVALEILDTLDHDIDVRFACVKELVLFVKVDVRFEIGKMDRRVLLHRLCEIPCDAVVRAGIARFQNHDEAAESAELIFDLLDVAGFASACNSVLQLQIPSQVHDGVNAQKGYRQENQKDYFGIGC